MGDFGVEFKPIGLFFQGDNGERIELPNITNVEFEPYTEIVSDFQPVDMQARFNNPVTFEGTFTAPRHDIAALIRASWGWKCGGHIRKRNLIKAHEQLITSWRRQHGDLCNG